MTLILDWFKPRNQQEAFCLIKGTSLSTEMVRLSVSPQITAEYGKPATLRCNISSKSPGELEVKHMKWSQNKTLCSISSEGNVTTHREHSPSDFQCEFKDRQLSLVFKSVQPLDIGRYMCKLQSNMGASHEYSRLELEGQCMSILIYNWMP